MPTAETTASSHPRADVIVIGDGVIGLSTAYELGAAGVATCVVGMSQPGAASGAAAGLLAPSIGALSSVVQTFFTASLNQYPGFVDRLREHDPELAIVRGLIELPQSGQELAGGPSNSVQLSPAELSKLEPEVAADWGGRLHPDDGAIDNVRLMAALRAAIATQKHVVVIHGDPVSAVDPMAGHVHLRSTRRLEAETIVLASGAWSSLIAGLPRALPIAPLKGQMLAVASSAIKHAVMGDDVYLVPRAKEVVIGATTEHDGFDLTISDEAIEGLHRAASRLVPSLAAAAVLRRWSGIRPATPDMLPILGRDPECPRLIYACGHSKNGILLAPATAELVGCLARGVTHSFDIAPFAVDRFSALSTRNS